MSVYLRGMLFAASVFTCIYIARKIRRSQVQVMDMLFWVVASAVLVLMGAFPSAAIGLAELLQFDSPANLVFLVIIFLLLSRCFLMSVRLSQVENAVRTLAEEVAVREVGQGRGCRMGQAAAGKMESEGFHG